MLTRRVMLGLVLIVVMSVAMACGEKSAQDAPAGETQVVHGRILEVEARSFSEIGKLTIGDDSGTTWRFGEQRKAMSGFNPSHLRDHMVQGLRITVTFHREDGELVIDDIAD